MHKPRGGKLGSLIIQVLVTRLSKFELSLHIAAATFHKLLLSVRSVFTAFRPSCTGRLEFCSSTEWIAVSYLFMLLLFSVSTSGKFCTLNLCRTYHSVVSYPVESIRTLLSTRTAFLHRSLLDVDPRPWLVFILCWLTLLCINGEHLHWHTAAALARLRRWCVARICGHGAGLHFLLLC